MEEVENLLLAQFYLWEHRSSEHKDIACEEYHVPRHIQEHIDYVTPGIRMRSRSVKKRRNEVDAVERRSSSKEGLSAYNRNPQGTMIDSGSYPGSAINSTSCHIYVTAECIRGTLYQGPGVLPGPPLTLSFFPSLSPSFVLF